MNIWEYGIFHGISTGILIGVSAGNFIGFNGKHGITRSSYPKVTMSRKSCRGDDQPWPSPISKLQWTEEHHIRTVMIQLYQLQQLQQPCSCISNLLLIVWTCTTRYKPSTAADWVPGVLVATWRFAQTPRGMIFPGPSNRSGQDDQRPLPVPWPWARSLSPSAAGAEAKKPAVMKRWLGPHPGWNSWNRLRFSFDYLSLSILSTYL